MINVYDRNLDALSNYKYLCMLSNQVEIINDITVYKNYIISKYGKNYIKTFKLG